MKPRCTSTLSANGTLEIAFESIEFYVDENGEELALLPGGYAFGKMVQYIEKSRLKQIERSSPRLRQSIEAAGFSIERKCFTYPPLEQLISKTFPEQWKVAEDLITKHWKTLVKRHAKWEYTRRSKSFQKDCQKALTCIAINWSLFCWIHGKDTYKLYPEHLANHTFGINDFELANIWNINSFAFKWGLESVPDFGLARHCIIQHHLDFKSFLISLVTLISYYKEINIKQVISICDGFVQMPQHGYEFPTVQMSGTLELSQTAEGTTISNSCYWIETILVPDISETQWPILLKELSLCDARIFKLDVNFSGNPEITIYIAPPPLSVADYTWRESLTMGGKRNKANDIEDALMSDIESVRSTIEEVR
jgi:hypothetical protein